MKKDLSKLTDIKRAAFEEERKQHFNIDDECWKVVCSLSAVAPVLKLLALDGA